MGNRHAKPHPKPRNKKQVHWKAADRPQPPGKPYLSPDSDLSPDLVTICWSKPVRDGGSPVTGYLVEHRRTGSPHWVRATPLLVPFTELSLSGLEPGWRYQFRVSAENVVGLSEPSDISEPLTITFQKFAITAPRFTEELEDITALENGKVEFTAHYLGQPIPKISWFKDGFEIFSSRCIRILTESDRSILTIHQCALSDEGEIKCTATNKAGHASTKARLYLEAPPSIRLPRQYEEGLLFEIGEVIRLKVSVAGRPTPLIFWSHNGETIQNNDRYEIEYVDKSSVLKLGEARRSDRGEYQIKAVNKIGEDLCSFLVTITDKPSPPGRARVVMTLGRSVTLSWSTPNDDGGCKIGNYIVEYYRMGWNVWLKAATSRQLSTILGDLIEGSEYKFRVKAESPYGVSDPSEESEVIFIPDPRRGITTPQARSRSQPRDIIDEITTPVAARRLRKPQQRSQTTPIPSPPIRPERIKTKTPDSSPLPARRIIPTTIIDTYAIATELTYGSPDLKMKKDLEPLISISSSSSNTSSPTLQMERSASKSPVKPSNQEVRETPSSPKVLRENSDNFAGSTEFMLVLYPDANEKGATRKFPDFEFDDSDIPPPLSLSAPELGIEPPIFGHLKSSSSSTELLHERAMIRFNEAAAREDEELRKRRLLDIPKIQINSKDDEDIVGLERKNSRRRLSAGGTVKQQALWAQRRLSLKNPSDSFDLPENKLQKVPKEIVNGRQQLTRQRSESEEREEEQFVKIRRKMNVQGQSSFEKRSIEVVDEEKWLEDYEESLSESETESSDEAKLMVYDDEEDTWHPSELKNEEPFEILTKRNKLPDPNFVPKPILKKSDETVLVGKPAPEVKSSKIRSHSPMPHLAEVPNTFAMSRKRSQSLAQSNIPLPVKSNTLPNVNKSRQRSYSLVSHDEADIKEEEVSKMLASSIQVAPGFGISAIASISGVAAASIVIPDRLLNRKKDDEEAKVVVDHYGDIVKNFGDKRRTSLPATRSNQPLVQAQSNSASIQSSEFVWPESRRKDSLTYSQSQDNSVKHELNQRRQSSSSKSSLGSEPVESRKKDSLTYSQSPDKSPVRSNRSETLRQSSSIYSSSKSSLASEVSDTKESWDDRKSSTESFKPKSASKESSGTIQRGRMQSRSSKKVSSRSKTPSKSPSKLRENWDVRKASPSPSKRNVGVQMKNKSPSPIPLARRPMLKEIMTQTSVGLDLNYSSDSRASTPSGRSRQEELLAQAEVKVRSTVDYVTDLAMFFVACWLYIFGNELLAIPVLVVMVYRQLKDEVRKRIPKWILKRFNKGKTKKK